MQEVPELLRVLAYSTSSPQSSLSVGAFLSSIIIQIQLRSRRIRITLIIRFVFEFLKISVHSAVLPFYNFQFLKNDLFREQLVAEITRTERNSVQVIILHTLIE